MTDFIFLGFKTTVDCDCSHEIWKKSYDKPRQCVKKQDITLPMFFFLEVIYRCESWTIKKAEHESVDFDLQCWGQLLRVPWTAKKSNRLILKEITEYSLEGLMLKLKFLYFGHLM